MAQDNNDQPTNLFNPKTKELINEIQKRVLILTHIGTSCKVYTNITHIIVFKKKLYRSNTI